MITCAGSAGSDARRKSKDLLKILEFEEEKLPIDLLLAKPTRKNDTVIY